jgi:hypothetical protein
MVFEGEFRPTEHSADRRLIAVILTIVKRARTPSSPPIPSQNREQARQCRPTGPDSWLI